MARYIHNCDQKGRIFLPAKLREQLGPLVYVTISLDLGYLSLYTAEHFQSLQAELNSLPGTDPRVRRLRRVIIGEAEELKIDGQGRISISQTLWSHIGLTAGEQVCLIDLGQSMQICRLAFYEEQQASELSLADIDLSDFEIQGVL